MIQNTPPHLAVQRAQHWLRQQPQKALSNFTWVNNMTIGAPYCRFAYADEQHCLARHLWLPFTAISVEGRSPATTLQLARELLVPDEAAYTLAPPGLTRLLTASMHILDIRPEWQMLFHGRPDLLPSGQAQQLHPSDLPAMLALAATDEVMVFSPETFARGSFFGVYIDAELVAMGGVQTRLPGLVEIGSIVTHPRHRRRGYASQVVSALLQHLHAQGQQIFLCLFQTNAPARLLYEKIGFQVINELSLIHWRLPN
ncbi:MAG: GNAT family N-acetyltransferase [Chloroflexi bacterium]|nr:GNAT family N-acetyltransferase [Chloroflexota bacterium]